MNTLITVQLSVCTSSFSINLTIHSHIPPPPASLTPHPSLNTFTGLFLLYKWLSVGCFLFLSRSLPPFSFSLSPSLSPFHSLLLFPPTLPFFPALFFSLSVVCIVVISFSNHCTHVLVSLVTTPTVSYSYPVYPHVMNDFRSCVSRVQT